VKNPDRSVEPSFINRIRPSSSVGTDHRRHSGESRNPFSSADGIGHAPPFPPRGCRVQALRGDEVVAPPPGKKSKWIPAFAGMTVFFLRFDNHDIH